MYFDDLSVSQVHSPFVAGGDFYPFGLRMEDRQITVEPYRYGYQGQFSEYDSLTKTNIFQLRLYDSRFGRWLSPDPYGQFFSSYVAMGDDPVGGTDPDGGLCCENEFILDDLMASVEDVSKVSLSAEATAMENSMMTASMSGGYSIEKTNDFVRPSVSGFDAQNPTQLSEVVVNGTRGEIAPPSLLVSMIPVVGSALEAASAFSKGNYWTGAMYTGLAISDVFLVKALATAAVKGAVSLAAKGSTRAFFSGSKGYSAAVESGYKLIGDTRAGKNLTNLIDSRGIEYLNEGKTMWGRLSTPWARGASEAHFYGNPNIPGSIWKEIEEPILKARGVKIHYHIH